MYGTQAKITEPTNSNLHGRFSSDKTSHITIFGNNTSANLEYGKELVVSYDFDPLGSFFEKVVFRIDRKAEIEIGLSNEFDEYRIIVRI